MKRLLIALDLSSLQPLIDDGISCQILSHPLDSGLLRVSLSLSVWAPKCVCALAGVHMCLSLSLFLACVIFLTTFVLVREIHVCATVPSALGCCDLGYRLRQVSGVLRGISCHINNKTSCKTESPGCVRATHAMKFLTPVTLLRWQGWSAGYCLDIVLCSCVRWIYYLRFWGRFWMTCSDRGEQVRPIQSGHQECVHGLLCTNRYAGWCSFYLPSTLGLRNRPNKPQNDVYFMRRLSNQCREKGKKPGSFSCGGPAAHCLTLLKCVHLFVPLKWYRAMAQGCEKSPIEQL